MRPEPSMLLSDSRELAINDGFKLPSTLSRRHLLAGGAALGAAGKLSLLSAAILGSSHAQAASTTYNSVSWTPITQYYIGSTLYEYSIGNAYDRAGNLHKWILTRRSYANANWHGIVYLPDASDAVWYHGLTVSGKTFNYTIKIHDLNCRDWPDTGTRRRANAVAWNLPSGATNVQYFEVPPEDSNEEVFNAVSFRSGNVDYLRFVHRTYTVANGGWTTRAWTQVTGADRTAVINLLTLVKEKARLVRIGRGVAISTVSFAAGAIVAGATVQGVIAKDYIPIWVMAAGIATLTIAGIGATGGAMAAMVTLTTATANLIVKCEELYSAV